MAWYEIYPKLPAEEFTYENSGARSGFSPPYREVFIERSYTVAGIVGEFGNEQLYTVVGYSLDMPFRPKYNSVAVMFEERDTFEKTWWHFPS